MSRSGRVLVEPDLTLPGHPDVFVIGDMMALDRLPGVSPVAIQGAKHAAKQISRRVTGSGEVSRPFRYRDKGSMATISRFRAVASIGPLHLRGFISWFAWLAVHLIYLTAFKNRITALLHWAVSFVGRGRSERTATFQQVVARTRLQRLEQTEAAASIGATSRPVDSLEL